MLAAQTKLTRRTLLAGAAMLAGGAAVQTATAAPADDPRADLVWDVHCHFKGAGPTPEAAVDRMLEIADRVDVHRIIVHLGNSRLHDPPPDVFRQDNDEVLRAVRHAPRRVLGFVYLNPNYVEASLRELERCVADGPLLGVKLWVARRCNHPSLDPLVRRAGQLGAPILQHTYWRVGPNLPGESFPADIAALAARHPNVPIIAAHLGNDWERGIRAIRHTPNAYAEVSGFDPTAGIVEMAVRELGAERVIYGSDAAGRSFASQLAKVYSAQLPPAAERLVLSGNIKRLLGPIMRRKGMV
jgi:predicted TIM-barrel fold metal-dependent hydrolase